MSITKYKESIDERDILGVALALNTLQELNMEYEILYNRSPLAYAVGRCFPQAVSMLIDAGAEVKSVNSQEQGLLHLVLGLDHSDVFEVAKLLIEAEIDIQARDRRGCTALHHASSHGETKIVRLLLNAGAHTDVREDNYEQTPLHNAIFTDRTDIVQLFIEAGADIEIANIHGWRPLHFAVEGANSDITDMLLKAGADVNARCNDLRTPLHFGAERWVVNSLEMLIKGGADLDAQDINGQTALHIATEEMRSDMVDVLLKAGASSDIKDDEGKTAQDISFENDNRSLLF